MARSPMDSEYVRTRMGKCILEGLSELFIQQPVDPIEFLAQWILKYKENLTYNEKRASFQRWLKEELQKVKAKVEETAHEEKNTKAVEQKKEEASELPSLKPQLGEPGVPLYTVVKENIKTETDFKPYFAGEIFVDVKGILLEQREKEFGDKVNMLAVLRAARKIREAGK